MRKSFAYLLLFLLCFSVLAGCTEYGTKAVESITDNEFKATYESYNKTVTKKIPSIPDSILAIQVQELQFKEGKVIITVTDPKGNKLSNKLLSQVHIRTAMLSTWIRKANMK